MEAQPNCSVSGLQDLRTELTKIVPEMSGFHEQCIYRVPQTIRTANPEAYTPQVVSIGPFHHKPHGSGGDLEPMEELKLKYLKAFLNRTQLCVDNFVPILEYLENRIRSCYAGSVNFDSNYFLKIIIIDACFIIEYFIRYCSPKEWMRKDRLLFKPWLDCDIEHDLILLENQLPFFVLEYIYKFAGINHNLSFLEVTFIYFQSYNKQNMSPDTKSVRPKHFTDLLRTFMLPSSSNVAETKEGDAVEHVYSARPLSEAELEIKFTDQSNMNPKRVRPKCFTDLLRTFMLPSSSNVAETKEGDAVEHVYITRPLSEAELEIKFSDQSNMNPKRVHPKCFTDLLRTFMLPSSSNVAETKEGDAVEHVYSASPLSEAELQIKFSDQSNMNPKRVHPKCFTDLLRTFMLPSSSNVAETKEGDAGEHVYSASQLSEVGLEFKFSEQRTCLLDIEYHEGVLTMPHLTVHDGTETYLRNILAFEECHLPADSAYISQYLKILDFLINTERDVNILVGKKIIANWMGDDNSVATMVNNLCKNVSMPDLNPKYLSICQSLNRFYKNPHNKYMAIFKNEYFNTPWKKASTIAAVLLLLLTLTQTICSVWSLL